MKMKVLLTCLSLLISSVLLAQNHSLKAHRGVVPNAYNFWVSTPSDYAVRQQNTPVILFLHGASRCGKDMNRSLRYGPMDAIRRGSFIPALIIIPQNPGGAWNPDKVNAVLEWTMEHYACDSNRVYVIGMSLGGYGTLDYVCTYPHKVAAAMALCGGCSQKDVQPLGEVPLWIIHGTGDRIVPVSKSKEVVKALERNGNATRLRYDWPRGLNHGRPVRYFYCSKTYEWLFSHSLDDVNRPVCRDIKISPSDLTQSYRASMPFVPMQ